MPERHDVIVVGVGGMGSATAFHLAERGVDVLALERYDVPHTRGSSHGATRIIRKPQYLDPAYVPLVRRAYDRWRSLEARTGRDLLYVTGGLDMGPTDSAVVRGSLRSCEAHDIDHETLTAAAVNDRFPGYDIPEDHTAVYQPESGFLAPAQCIVAHVTAAQAEGAVVRAREPVTGFTPLAHGGFRVSTSKDTYEADRLVVTAGAWTREILPELADLAVPERQVLAWFQPTDTSAFAPDSFPVFVHETDEGHFYGTPRFDVPGVKVGKYNHRNETADPGSQQPPGPEDERLLRAYAERYFPAGAGPTMQLATCMFTNTPDQHFVLDTLPDRPRVTVGAGFSGHGFKFSAVIGEVLADLATDEPPAVDIERFRLDRF